MLIRSSNLQLFALSIGRCHHVNPHRVWKSRYHLPPTTQPTATKNLPLPPNLDSPENYLGLNKTMEGTWSFQLQKQKDQMQELACRASDSAMTRYNASLIYQVWYKPALSYPLYHKHFTHPQCNAIQSPFINAILPKMGFNRHMPRAIIFGPSLLGRAALADAKVEQTVNHIPNMIVALQKTQWWEHNCQFSLQPTSVF